MLLKYFTFKTPIDEYSFHCTDQCVGFVCKTRRIIFNRVDYYELDFTPYTDDYEGPKVLRNGKFLGTLHDLSGNKQVYSAYNLFLEQLTETEEKEFFDYLNLYSTIAKAKYSLSLMRDGEAFIDVINISLDELYKNLECLACEDSHSYDLRRIVIINKEDSYKKVMNYNT